MKIFLSHSSPDKDIVESIASWLSKKGYKIWLDKWCMTPGDSLVEKISEGIDTSDKLVVFLTPDSVTSNWVKKEVATGVVLEIAEDKGLGINFVIPVLLKNCKVPVMLRDKLYANFTDKSFEAACNQLMLGFEGTPTGPLDAVHENRKISKHAFTKQDGNFALLIEFGVTISPTSGVHLGIDVGANFKIFNEWFDLPDKKTIPANCGGVFTDSATRNEPPIFARKFSSPNIEASKSYYVYFESDSPFDIRGIQFYDFYDRIP